MTSQVVEKNSTRANYGLDAPGLVRFFFIAGTVCLILLSLGTALHWPGQPWNLILAGLLVLATYLLGMGGLMVFESKITKPASSAALLNRVSWRGDELVLDAGCGRGLMLIQAAKHLSSGRAIGIDLWRTVDQTGNKPEATLENAQIEGVAEKIEIKTGDICTLPFADGQFDLVLSSWVVHNLDAVADRAQALSEMVRVMKPGAQMILVDISNLAEYESELTKHGFREIQRVENKLKNSFLAAVSFGSYVPAAIVARKTSA